VGELLDLAAIWIRSTSSKVHGGLALSADWTPIGVELAIVVVLLGRLGWCLRAKDSVHGRYGRRPRDARLAIEGEIIIPRLGRLVEDASQLALSGQQSTEQALQQMRYKEPLDQLYKYYEALNLLDILPQDIEKWITRQAWALAGLLMGSLLFMAQFCVKNLDPPGIVTYGGILTCAVAATLISMFFALEAQGRNRLSALLAEYEPAAAHA
jgi:hypothetical protein